MTRTIQEELYELDRLGLIDINAGHTSRAVADYPSIERTRADEHPMSSARKPKVNDFSIEKLSV